MEETPNNPIDSKIPTFEVTFKELVFFIADAARYAEKYPKERSRVTFVLIKQTNRYEKKRIDLGKELDLEINAIRVKHASVDGQGNLVENKYDVKAGKGEDSSILRFTYKPEKLTQCEKEIETLKTNYENKKIKIEAPFKSAPFFLDIPEKFDFHFLEHFKKFVFNPDISEADEEQIYLQKETDPEQTPTVKPVVTKT